MAQIMGKVRASLVVVVAGAGIAAALLWPERNQAQLGYNSNNPPPKENNCNSNDPVDLATGGYFAHHLDVSIPTRGIPLEFTRTYYSATHTLDGPLGFGWAHTYLAKVFIEESGDVLVRMPNGQVHRYTPDGSGGFVPPAAIHNQLTRNPDESFTLVTQSREVHQFSALGDLLSMADRNGNTTTMQYGAGRLITVTAPDARTLELHYDAAGRLTEIVDPLSRTFQYGYDTAGNLSTVTDPLGRVTTFGYDGDHRLVSVTDSMGHVVQNVYDGDQVVSQTDAQGGVTTFDYSGAQTTLTNPRGQQPVYSYDALQRISAIKDAAGGITSFQYDAASNLASVTNPLGHTTSFSYDASGNILARADALGQTTTYTYDATSNQWLTQTDPNGHTTTRTLDAKGNVLTEIDPLGHVATHTYDANGRLLARTDALGNTTTFAYDPQGNLISRTDPLGSATTFTYDLAGRLLTTTDPHGHVTTNTYDSGNRVAQTTFADGSTKLFTYDGGDRLLTQTDELGHTTTLTYGAPQGECDEGCVATGRSGSGTHQPETITDPLGNSTTFTYDGNGNVLTVTNANSHTTSHTYDAADRLLTITDPDSHVTTRAYDLPGRLISVTDAKGQVTSYSYDAADRLIQTTFPDGTTETQTYDASGNRLTFTNRAGQTISYTYDSANRLTARAGALGNAAFTYDNANRLTQVSEPGIGNFRFEYDAASRLIRAVQPAGVVRYAYDEAGLRTRLRYPDDSAVNYAYDALHRLTTLRDRDTGDRYAFAYDAASQRTKLTLPNGVSTTYTYDNAGRLTQLKSVNAAAETLQDLAYTYDAAGNSLTRTNSVGPHAYTYDPRDQLTAVTYPTGFSFPNSTFSYDAVGNRSNVNTTPYTVNSLNQYTQVGSAPFTYDQKGNLISDGGNTYTYDAANRLIQVVTPTVTITYQYDWSNRLVKKTAGGQITRFVYDGWTVIAEANNGGNVRQRYVAGPRVDEMLAQDKGANVRYLLHDALGSTTALVRPNGKLQQQFRYDVFGSVTVHDQAGALVPDLPRTNYLFTGRELQVESGLYNYRNRFYRPNIGRFLQADPIGFSGGDVNWYRYVNNNPVNRKDPTGTTTLYARNEFGGEVTVQCPETQTACGKPPGKGYVDFPARGVIMLGIHRGLCHVVVFYGPDGKWIAVYGPSGAPFTLGGIPVTHLKDPAGGRGPANWGLLWSAVAGDPFAYWFAAWFKSAGAAASPQVPSSSQGSNLGGVPLPATP